MLYAKQVLTLIFALASQFHVYLPWLRTFVWIFVASSNCHVVHNEIFYAQTHFLAKKKEKKRKIEWSAVITRVLTNSSPQPRLWTQTGASPALMGSNHLRSTLLFWPGMYLYVRNKYHSSTWCTNETGRGKKGKIANKFLDETLILCLWLEL